MSPMPETDDETAESVSQPWNLGHGKREAGPWLREMVALQLHQGLGESPSIVRFRVSAAAVEIDDTVPPTQRSTKGMIQVEYTVIALHEGDTKAKGP
jgi:hypothetical protein